MRNELRRFVAMLMSVMMLITNMPVSALADTVTDTSGYGNYAVSAQPMANAGELAPGGSATIQIGDSITLSGSRGNSSQWTVSPDNGGLTLSGASNACTATGVQKGTYTVTHTYRWFGSNSETFTVIVSDGTITVTFDSNGGAGTVDPIVVTTAGLVILPSGNGLSNLGATFMGWGRTPNAGKDNVGNAGFDVTIYPAGGSMQVDHDITLYAVWAVSGNATYFVRLNGVIPTEPGSFGKADYTSGMAGTVKYNTFYANSSGVDSHLGTTPTVSEIRSKCNEKVGSIKFTDGSAYTACDSDEEFAANYYVRWYVIKTEQDGVHVDGVLLKRTLYSLTYSPNCADYSGTLPLAEQYREGTVVGIISNELTRPGYTFNGWNTEPDGSGTPYRYGDSITMPNHDVVLYAQWIPKTHGITYRYEGDPDKADYPTNAPLPNNESPVRVGETRYPPADPEDVPGYTFVGWNTPDTITEWNEDGSYAMPDADVAWVGVWQKVPFTVTYEYEGDVPAGAPQIPEETHTYHDEVTVAADPQLEGYVFEGWYTKEGSEVEVQQDDVTFTMPAANVILYGRWTRVTGNLEITKIVENGHFALGEHTFTFEITDVANNVRTASVTVNVASTDSQDTNGKASGTVTVEGLMEGTYTVEEVGVPDSFVKPAAATVTVEAGKTASVTMTNTGKNPTVTAKVSIDDGAFVPVYAGALSYDTNHPGENRVVADKSAIMSATVGYVQGKADVIYVQNDDQGQSGDILKAAWR